MAERRYDVQVAKPGVKIKDLARELGVTARALIDRCRAEGLWVQNSIGKLTFPQADRVRSWFSPISAASTPSQAPPRPHGPAETSPGPTGGPANENRSSGT